MPPLTVCEVVEEELPEDLGYGGVAQKSRRGAQVPPLPLAQRCQTCWALWFWSAERINVQTWRAPLLVATKQRPIKHGTESRRNPTARPAQPTTPLQLLAGFTVRSRVTASEAAVNQSFMNQSNHLIQCSCRRDHPTRPLETIQADEERSDRSRMTLYCFYCLQTSSLLHPLAFCNLKRRIGNLTLDPFKLAGQ